MALRAKVLEYAASVDRLGSISAHGHEPVALGAGIGPEHLVLAALVRCSIASLRYHARRLGADILGEGRAHGVVTKRASDLRYAFVEIHAAFEVEIEPVPEDLAALLAKAERDCFVSASLTVEPVYSWTVNGSAV